MAEPENTQSLHTVREGSSQGSVASRPTCLGKLAKLSSFSGGETIPTGEVCFEQWCFELEDRKRRLSEADLQSAIICSLKGPAAALIRRLGVGTSSERMREALEARYGPDKPLSALRADLYSTVQKKNESFQTYLDRVEQNFSTYKKLGGWNGTSSEEETHLKGIVYEGIRSDLKSNLRFTERDASISYGEFQKIAKTVEKDLKGERVDKSVSAKATTKVSDSNLTGRDWDTLNKRFEELTASMVKKVEEMAKRSQSPVPYCKICKQQGHPNTLFWVCGGQPEDRRN